METMPGAQGEAKILDGKSVAAQVRQEVAARCSELVRRGITPGLAVVLVGDDPASHMYVRNKRRAAEAVGVAAQDYRFAATTSAAELRDLLVRLNGDDQVDGILVQLPLPPHVDSEELLAAISPQKDVDGLHPDNVGRLAKGKPRFVPATPRGCMRLLAEAGVDLEGASAVVVGRSQLVGRPMASLLTNANATVTLCHSRTRDLAGAVRGADIVVAAVGRPQVIRGQWIKPGATVIDVGINRGQDQSLVGDVEFAVARSRAFAITPVPGGVGPMTIASLLANTVEAAAMRRRGASPPTSR